MTFCCCGSQMRYMLVKSHPMSLPISAHVASLSPFGICLLRAYAFAPISPK
ncbi:hypothetical protein EJ04DRAFT_596278 [Polyplosphaeria fusca]|uniref:Uncharacterized protein n=1 Tax=Polyplosphaeria fusca TaxID=682080 RepID=A0A9P4QGT3_9PLEO|nr:hypothetical protein EJ04DRAFT_596278 [Polyplosphaeria fusca]